MEHTSSEDLGSFLEKNSGEDNQLMSSSQYLRAFVHFLRLNLILSWVPWSRSAERPKIAIYKDRLVATLYSITHVIPLATATALITLNGRTTIIAEYSTSATAGIQFAAKFFEVLTQASLASIFLSLVREQLLTEKALPLGSLLAPLQVTNVSLLWSLEVWGSVCSDILPKWQKTFFLVTTCTLVALAALVGPSGAVLMIPRPITIPQQASLFVLDSENIMAPKAVRAQTYQADDYFFNEDSIKQTMAQIDLTRNLSRSSQFTYEIQDRWSLREAYIQSNPNSSAIARHFDLSTFPTSTIAQSFQLHSANQFLDEQTLFGVFKQPLVRIICKRTSQTLTNFPFHPPNATQYVSFDSDNEDLNRYLTWNETFTRFNIDVDGDSTDNHFYAFVPPASSQHSIAMVNWLGGYTIDACCVDAVWTDAQYNFTTATSRLNTNNAEDTLNNQEVWRDQSSRISIEPELIESYISMWKESRIAQNSDRWLSPDTILIAVTLALSYAGPSPTLPVLWPEPQGTSLQNYLNTTGVVAEYGGSFRNIKFMTTTAWTDPSTLTYLKINAHSDLYGYSPAHTTVKLSLAVISVYCVLVTAHIAYSILTGRVGSSWDGLGDLFMLALNSKPPEHIRYTSVGARSTLTYKQPVNVPVNEDHSIEVKFVNDTGTAGGLYKRVVPNREY